MNIKRHLVKFAGILVIVLFLGHMLTFSTFAESTKNPLYLLKAAEDKKLSPRSDTVNTYNNIDYPLSAYKKGIEPGFSMDDEEIENIDPLTGDLAVSKTDLSLKGKNGFDLSLTRYYTLSQSNLFETQVKEVVDGYGNFIGYTNDSALMTYNEKFYNIGSGWAFDFPSIEYRGGKVYLRYGQRGVWAMDAIDVQTFKPSNYNLDDVILKVYRSYTNDGRTSEFMLEEKDGRKYYFCIDGMLIGMSDRFGNGIKFSYVDVQDVYGFKHPVLTKIIDSCSRTINLQYDTTNYNKVTISITDGSNTKTIYYNLARIKDKFPTLAANIPDNDYLLDNVVDPENRTTQYSYDCRLAKQSLIQRDVVNNPAVNNYYACLKEIMYPTKNGYRTYVYQAPSTKNCGPQGAMQFYKVSQSISDSNTYGEIENTRFIANNYAYNIDGTCELDGYPWYLPGQNGPSYVVKTQVNDNLGGSSKLYTYSQDGLLTNLLYQSSDHKTETIQEYNSNKLLTKTINKIYDQAKNQYVEKVENFTFDTKRNLIGYWGVGSSRDSTTKMPLNDEFKISYTYNSQYNYVTSKTYKKDLSTTIVETYTPSADNKTIQYSKITENGSQKSEITYSYDSYGNITYQANAVGDGTYQETNYQYTNGAFVNRKYSTAIRDCDGNLVDAKSTNSLGVVDENYIYDTFGNLKQKQDANGNTTTYNYDNLNRIIRETAPDGSYKTYQYICTNTENSVTIKDENLNSPLYSAYGKETKIYYDALGNFSYEKDIKSGQIIRKTQYDPSNKKKIETDKNGTFTTFKYTADGRLKEKWVQDVNYLILRKEVYTYDDATDGINDTTTNCTLSKVTKKIDDLQTSYSKSIVTNSYINKMEKVEREERVGSSTYENTYKYDYLGNKVEEKLARAYVEDWPETYTSKFEYTYDGKVTNQYNVNGDFSTIDYDWLGRIKAKTDIAGNKSATKYSTTYMYDGLGRLIKESTPFEIKNGVIYCSIKKSYYDRNGNISWSKISKNKAGEPENYNQIEYQYDNRNRLVKTITYNNGVAENYIQYYYDSVGNKLRMYTGLSNALIINGLDAVIPVGDSDYSVTKYEYDQFGRIKKFIDPLGNNEQYIYDLKSPNHEEVTKMTDRNGNTTTIINDGMGRVISKSVLTPGGNDIGSYTYGYDIIGNRVSMSGGGINTTYEYDNLGRLTLETNSTGVSKGYQYDAADNRTMLFIGLNNAGRGFNQYKYDKLNRLTELGYMGSTIATYAYDINSNRKALSYENSNGTDYTYNLANNVTNLTNKKGTLAISQYDYTYYLDGNQASKSELNGKTTSYVYDGLGRLTSEVEMLNGSITTDLSYKYDDYNNRKTMSNNGVIINYNYDKNNRLLSESKTENTVKETVTYAYDNNGNQIYKAKESIGLAGSAPSIALEVAGENVDCKAAFDQYEGFNQLSRAIQKDKTVDYTYDGDGLRQTKSVNGITTTHAWDGKNVMLDLECGDIKLTYLRGTSLIAAADGLLARQCYYMFNAHGDVTQLTDSAGDVSRNYDYSAFGVEKSPNANDGNAWRYCGEYFDKETETVYLRARYYSPSIGRFINEDSIRGNDAEDPLSLNLYTYCSNNPINLSDPSGHEYGSIRKFTNDYGGDIKLGEETKKSSTYIGSGIIIETKNQRKYAEITIRGKTQRFYFDEYTIENGRMQCERADFLKKMGFDVSVRKYEKDVGMGEFIFNVARKNIGRVVDNVVDIPLVGSDDIADTLNASQRKLIDAYSQKGKYTVEEFTIKLPPATIISVDTDYTTEIIYQPDGETVDVTYYSGEPFITD